MTWTIVCDLPMKSYQGNQALDATSYHNHGNVIGSVNQNYACVNFYADDGEVEIPITNDSLNKFTALRIQALIKPEAIVRRYNIVEGWMSFAFVIEADGRLHGTIYDGQNWDGVDSGNTKVPANQWSRVGFEYDGVSYGKIMLNGNIVGTSLALPTGMRQPQQVITLGHWPRGDHRYTFKGAIGHVRIEKRDFEDFWRDAMATAFCRKPLTAHQTAALRELEFILKHLDEKEALAIKRCAAKQSELIIEWMNKIRSLIPRGYYSLRKLGVELREAWCCIPNIDKIRIILLHFIRSIKDQADQVELEKFMALLEEFFKIAHLCQRKGKPYDRINELMKILFPELDEWETAIREIAAAA